MGADITFYKGDNNFYFRDSYNETNLGWVIGLSYWSPDKRTKESRKAFFAKLIEITDKQIEERVKKLYADPNSNIDKTEASASWETMFKEARESLRKHKDLIENADRISWSV